MDARSLKFQLIAWYAVLLSACLCLVGAVTYVALEDSLVRALRESQLRRARQVAQLLDEAAAQGQPGQVAAEVETRYAPGQNGRFVRISRQGGSVLYLSKAPRDQSFDSAAVPPPAWPSEEEETARTLPLLGGRKMLVTAHRLLTQSGDQFLVETGAPMDEVQADLRHWLVFLVGMLPVVALVALGGGYVLVKRALTAVDRITASAERISSHNLSERLPVMPTGDELERLSVALNRMIERLDTAFQHSRRFVADASHELRTPLTIIRGELEALAKNGEIRGETRDRLGSTLEEVDRLATIVEKLFAISRLDAGEAAAEWVRFDLGQLATSTADQMGLLAEDKHITVTCGGALGVWVEGDRARLKQVVVNLLDNAIKYTPEGGAVALNVRADNGKAVLEVSDNGLGIPPELLPRVFDRFFRTDAARGREQGGAGLGLSIVKSICAAHRGQVEVSSQPGRGTQVRVELPRVEAVAEPGAGAQPS